jgi:hypothetical protein
MPIVIRPKGEPKRGFLNLSPEAQVRAEEHLKSLGYDIDRIQPLVWPDDAVSAYKDRDHPYEPWKFVTKADVKKRRQERAKKVLRYKREDGVVYRRAAYVWTFYVPDWNFFCGWWLYIIGNGFSWGGKYQSMDCEIVRDVMRLFPLVEPVLFGQPDVEKWMVEFAKRYQRGVRGDKPQGKAPVRVEVKGNRVVKILERTEWPKK